MKEKELLEKGYRKYTGKDIDVFFHKEMCEHSGVCVGGVPSVFNTKEKPWINLENANAKEVMDTIDKCPSGALQYVRKYKVNHEDRRYYINWNNQMAAEMTYSKAGDGMIIIDHTFVDDQYRGEGLGKLLVYQAVEDARINNIKIIPLCPFAKVVFKKDSTIKDVLK